MSVDASARAKEDEKTKKKICCISCPRTNPQRRSRDLMPTSPKNQLQEGSEGALIERTTQYQFADIGHLHDDWYIP